MEINHEVAQLPGAELILAGITPRQLIRIAGPHLPEDYRLRLERFRYGGGAFKIYYAFSAPIPRTARECSLAATLHVGGPLEEIVETQRRFTFHRPLLRVRKPFLFDPRD